MADRSIASHRGRRSHGLGVVAVHDPVGRQRTRLTERDLEPLYARTEKLRPGMFSREWTVRWGDVDMFGIAYYPRIVEALHETADAYMEAAGSPFWELEEHHGVGLPIVEVDVEFHRPVRGGDTIVIELDADLGERSVRFDFRGVRDGTEAFTGYEQRVCVPFGGEEAVRVPDDLREAIATGP